MISWRDIKVGLRCPKALWLRHHMPDEAAKQNPLERKLSSAGRRRLENLARGLFPDGVDAYAGSDEASVQRTNDLLENGIETLFSAQFADSESRAKVDVVRRLPDGTLELLLIKGAKTLKPEYTDEAGYQCMVVARCGHNVSTVTVVHLGSDEPWNGEPLNPESFFRRTDITAKALKRADELRDRVIALSTLKTITVYPESAGTWPHLDPNYHKECPNCDYLGHCQTRWPEDLLETSFLSARAAKSLSELGITRLSEIRDRTALDGRDASLYESYLLGEPLRCEQLDQALATIEYPAFMVDFEAVKPAIPIIPGMKSYQTFPFQWSCHRLDRPPVPGSPATSEDGHFEFLWKESSDPRPAFVTTLLDLLGSTGSFVHWHIYEITQLKSLAAEGIPHAQELLDRVQSSNVDLGRLLAKHYFDARMTSTSIKNVLKAISDDVRYSDLAIGNGSLAMNLYERIYRGEVSSEERDRDIAYLLEYCKLDTWAMVLTLRAMLPR